MTLEQVLSLIDSSMMEETATYFSAVIEESAQRALLIQAIAEQENWSATTRCATPTSTTC